MKANLYKPNPASAVAVKPIFENWNKQLKHETLHTPCALEK